MTGLDADGPVDQVHRWLLERGIAVPTDGDGRGGIGGDGAAGHEVGGDGSGLSAEAQPRGRRSEGSAEKPRRAPSSRGGRHSRRSLPEESSEGDGPTPVLSGGQSPVRTSDWGVAGDDAAADAETLARTIVLRKLSAHARTRAELQKALDSKEVPVEAARTVLDRMEELGLVDDAGFARDWVESRQQRRHLSKSALRRELVTKGVDRDQIDSALEGVEAEDELSAARSLALKKAKTTVGLERQVRYRRLVGALGRRGFSSALVARVVAETLDDQG